MGQSQQGQPGDTAPLAAKLRALSLPPGAIADKDIPQMKSVIRQALAEINGSIKSAGQKVDYETLKSGILGFQDWLNRQSCVSRTSTKYDVESTDKYPSQIFYTYPGTLAYEMLFKWAGNTTKPYRLLIFVTTVDLFTLASLVEDTTTAGIPVPKEWPKNPWSCWDERLSYWDKRP